MKIEMQNPKTRELRDLENGDVFVYNNTLYMRAYDHTMTCNAVRLCDGHLEVIGWGLVKPVDATLCVKNID